MGGRYATATDGDGWATVGDDGDISTWCRETAAKLFPRQSPGAEAERGTLSHEAGANVTLAVPVRLGRMQPRLGDKEPSRPVPL